MFSYWNPGSDPLCNQVCLVFFGIVWQKTLVMFWVKFCQKCDSKNYPVSRNKVREVRSIEIRTKLGLINEYKVCFEPNNYVWSIEEKRWCDHHPRTPPPVGYNHDHRFNGFFLPLPKKTSTFITSIFSCNCIDHMLV